MKNTYALVLLIALPFIYSCSTSESAPIGDRVDALALDLKTSEKDYRHLQSPVKNQGARETCTAFAVAASLELLPGIPVDLSEKYLYGMRKTTEFFSNKNILAGDLLANYGPSLEKYGILEEDELPYDGNPVSWTAFDSRLTQMMQEGGEGPITFMVKYTPKAKFFLAPNSYLNYTHQQAMDTSFIIGLLNQGYLSIPVSYISLYKPEWDNHTGNPDQPISHDNGYVVDMPTGTKMPISEAKGLLPDVIDRLNQRSLSLTITADPRNYVGHAVNIVGYNKKGFIIKNSWGKGWGDNGYGYISYDYHRLRVHELSLFYKFIKK